MNNGHSNWLVTPFLMIHYFDAVCFVFEVALPPLWLVNCAAMQVSGIHACSVELSLAQWQHYSRVVAADKAHTR